MLILIGYGFSGLCNQKSSRYINAVNPPPNTSTSALPPLLDQLGPDWDQSLKCILDHFRAQLGTIHTLGKDGKLHLRVHSPGIPESVLAVTRVIPIGKGMAGLAVERKAPVNVCNLQQDQSGDVRPGAQATRAMGSLCVPMLAGNQAVGAIGIASFQERTFTDAEVQQLLDVGKFLARYALQNSK